MYQCPHGPPVIPSRPPFLRVSRSRPSAMNFWVAVPTPEPVRPGGPPAFASCLSPAVLLAALQPKIGLALWRRPPRPALHRPIATLLGVEPFCRTAEGRPETAIRDLMRTLPAGARLLGEDMLRLGRLFAILTGAAVVRFRLEHVTDNACHRHHVDAVRLRLLCTYAGAGTEWTDEVGRSYRMAAFHVGVFKGSAYPDNAVRTPHRSPPVEHLPPSRRARLLLCIDEPGVF
jgi:hypothetical protein